MRRCFMCGHLFCDPEEVTQEDEVCWADLEECPDCGEPFDLAEGVCPACLSET